MSDLISRQAVVKVIKEFFKTKVDEIPKRTKFEKLCDLCDLYLELNADLHKEIDAMPTAFDVDKVVEQLDADIMGDEKIRFVDQAVRRAISIVKGAVKE